MTARNQPPAAEIDRKQLEQAIRANGHTADDARPWTACRRPDRVLALDRDGGLRACDQAASSLADADANDVVATWRSTPFAELRNTLQDGTVPEKHCHGCAFWVRAHFPRYAPLAREATPDTDADAETPSHVVVQLPSRVDPSRTAARASKALASATHLIIDIHGALSEHLEPWLEPARRASSLDRIELRVASIGDVDAMGEQLTDLPIRHIELQLEDSGADTVPAAKLLATRLGATLGARFVVTPGRWFWFEQAARVADDAGIRLEWRLAHRDGTSPLASLPLKDLGFLQDAVGSCAPRFEHDVRPSSVAPDAYEHLTEELRLQLIQVGKERLAAHDAEPGTHCAVAPLDHPWLADPESRSIWVRQLFEHSHLACVYEWVERMASESTLKAHVWLRVLCQKVAWEKRPAGILSALRAVYEDADELPGRIEEDRAFETFLELGPLGGPWAQLLGIPPVARRQPIAITTTDAPDADPTDAKLTVLIPSFRHEEFIEGAIRSVLAQSNGNLRVLVCDDRSPDATAEVARAIDDPRLEVRVNDENVGLGNSVLAALATIDTPYVALLNSDDLFHPERIARCLEILEGDPEIEVVTTGLIMVDEAGGELTPETVSFVLDGIQLHNLVHWYDGAKADQDLPKEEVFEHLLERNFLATSSNLTARTDWLRSKHRAFRDLKYCLDWQVFLEAALEGSLHHIAAPLLGYRLHASNTVWFDEANRWSYYLEVNRVLAHALERLTEYTSGAEDETIRRVTRAVADHIALNREADGLALFLNNALDGLALDRAAGQHLPIRDMIDRLSHRSQEALRLADAEQNEKPNIEALQLLDHYRYEQIVSEKRTQLTHLFRTRERLDEVIARERRTRERLDEQVDQTKEVRENLKSNRERSEERLQELRQRLQETRDQLEARIGEVRSRAESAEHNARNLREQLTEQQSRTRAAHDRAENLLGQLDEARAECDARNEEREAMTAELALASADNERLHEELDTLRKAGKEYRLALSNLDQRRKQLTTERNQLLGELENLRRSREFRTGNFIWNKLPLNDMSRRAKKWYNRLVDAKNRITLWAGGKLRTPKAEGVAIVASCWHWPIYSHTFVYQEMLALTHMGLDVKMFHWAANDFAQLQPAFSYLKDNRVELKANMKQHRKDRDHFAATKPGRLDALLEKLSAATGRSVEDLGEDPQVLRGCTFARMAELANARYLHSYFFYDQSFMVLVASWLLEIPRGVSCYADHMLDDWPLKVVPLQLQLASVIVATSARIKEELVGLGGPEVADKIVVKPNGVNGERFPAIDRGERRPDEPFEVISISRLEPKKGLEYMIDAVAELKKRGRKLKVHIVGAVDTSLQASIDYGTELEQQIEKLGLEDEVLLHGMMLHEQIQPIMQRCRAFVAPYVELESGDKDGIPTAMLEALASGLPIVTTDSGSILEVVQDGVQALVTPQRDSEAYGAALEKLIADPALERRMARAARQRFDEEFDITVTERRLHERVADTLRQPAAAR